MQTLTEMLAIYESFESSHIITYHEKYIFELQIVNYKLQNFSPRASTQIISLLGALSSIRGEAMDSANLVVVI